MTASSASQLSASSQAGHRTALVSQGVRVACKAVSVLVMARLVPPAEHGLYAMAATFVLLPYIVRDAGLNAVALQAEELSPAALNRLWRTQLVLAAGFTLLTLGCAPLVARFYHQPNVSPLVAGLALLFPLAASGAVPRLVLSRQMRLAEIARIETVAAVLATVGMIGAGGWGVGAASFMIFWLVNEGATAAGLAYFAGWRPTRDIEADLSRLWSQCRAIVGQNLLHQLTAQIDTVVLGRQFGPAISGAYARTVQLTGLPILHLAQPINAVMTATLARCRREPAAFRAHTTAALRLVAWLVFPCLALLAALPGPWIRLLLGPDWAGSAAFLPWLAASAACIAINTVLGGIALATDRVARLFAANLVALPLQLAAVLSGAHWAGAEGAVIGVACFQLCAVIPRASWVTSGTAVGIGLILRTLLPVGLACGAAFGAARFGVVREVWWEQLAVGTTAALLALLTVATIVPLIRTSALESWRFLFSLKPSPGPDDSGHDPTAQPR